MEMGRPLSDVTNTFESSVAKRSRTTATNSSDAGLSALDLK
ncbi:hypothetical protein PVAP13_3NG183309 [Panicum virgatum]|uniref:Uncharacterized protein n=1 Tax=Panicum virgatum TaxID=38727 RepID=A0A8T0UBF2_PANVG|nr:hypothetical protein PVAP13_3NG183309 [Panicum virgatum]